MTKALPTQSFQIGEEVQHKTFGISFVVGVIYAAPDDLLWYSQSHASHGSHGYPANELVLAPARPAYVPSERRIKRRYVTEFLEDRFLAQANDLYRPETDEEMAVRHNDERNSGGRLRAVEREIIYDAHGRAIGKADKPIPGGP